METFIIAEAGVNHNGDISRAIKMVKVAANSGADAIKFQSFKADRMVSQLAKKADYQSKNTGKSGSQLDMLKELELSELEQIQLAEECKKNNIEFMSTPFDIESADFLAKEINIRRFKVGSGEITNAPLLLGLGSYRKPIILSTGMSTIPEIQDALSVLAYAYGNEKKEPSSSDSFKTFSNLKIIQEVLRDSITLLHCTSLYPTQPESVNLLAIKSLSKRFNLEVGFSDHTQGISISLGAVALGAKVIEKHFTLDKCLKGPDHKASLEPNELNQMIKTIRVLETSLGSGEKIPFKDEYKTAMVARKSLVAINNIDKGDVFSQTNLGIKRPGTGISPFSYWDYLGQKAIRSYKIDEIIEPQ